MSSTNNRDSSVASTTRASGDTYLKVARPDFYYRDCNKLDDWLNQIMLYFRLEGIREDARKTIIALSYLWGEAQSWIRPKLQDALIRNIDKDRSFNDWDKFVGTIKGIYGLSND